MTDLGVMASMTQSLDAATCVAVAEGFGRIVGGSEEEDDFDEYVVLVSKTHKELKMLELPSNYSFIANYYRLDEDSALAMGYVMEEDDDPEDLEPRAPVVTIMGHGTYILYKQIHFLIVFCLSHLKIRKTKQSTTERRPSWTPFAAPT